MADHDARDESDSLRLIRRFQAGNHAAFRNLYLRWHGHVWAYARLSTAPDDAAEPHVERVFQRVLHELPGFSEATDLPFRGWLGGHMRRAVTSPGDAKSPLGQVLGPARDLGGRAATPKLDLLSLSDDELAAGIRSLAADDRHIVLLRLIFGLTACEAAAAYGADVDVLAVESRALERIRLAAASAAQADTLGAAPGEARRIRRVLRRRRRTLRAF